MGIKLVLFFQILINLVIRLVKYQQNCEEMDRGFEGRKVGGDARTGRGASGVLGPVEPPEYPAVCALVDSWQHEHVY